MLPPSEVQKYKPRKELSMKQAVYVQKLTYYNALYKKCSAFLELSIKTSLLVQF
jgi:hypothetical protein